MPSSKECIDYCDLGEEDIEAIARHEKIPEVLVAELAECLPANDVDTWLVKRYIADDLDRAQLAGRDRRVDELRSMLENFSSYYPAWDLG